MVIQSIAEKHLLLLKQLKELCFADLYANKKFAKYRVATGKKDIDLRKNWRELVSKKGLKIISDVIRVTQIEGMLPYVYTPLTIKACAVNTEVYVCLKKASYTKKITLNFSQSAHMQFKIQNLSSVLFN